MENLAGELYQLDLEASRPISVSLCPQSAFNCVEGRLERLVKEIEVSLETKGVFVSTSSQMWRGMFSVGGHQFRVTKKAIDQFLGKGVIWSVIERQLFRQRVFLMCASDRAKIDQLNERAHRAEESGIDVDRLKIVTGPPTLFNAFQGNDSSQKMSENAWKEFSGHQDRANSSRARRFQKKKKAARIDAEMAPTDLEPRDDNNVCWFPVDVENDDGLMCNICRANAGTEKFYKFKENACNCVNCSANDQCQYGVARDQGHYSRVAPELSEHQALMILATRIQYALETAGMSVMRIDVDFKDWLANVAASFVANAGLSYGEKLMKEVSHMGGVRVPEHQVREIFKSHRGKQFLVMRTEFLDPVSQEKIRAYRLPKDCGNVLYKEFLVKILDSAEKMNEIFVPTMATAEKAGDVIEFWLGLLDIAAMTKGVVNIFGDEVDPTKFLNGLEAAVRLFSKVARTTSTINSKRKGSFDCSLDARESDEVMNRLNQVDMYQRPNLFNYLTEYEAAVVLELGKDITQARDPMDTSSSANPDAPSGSSNQRVEGGTSEGEQPSHTAEDQV